MTYNPKPTPVHDLVEMRTRLSTLLDQLDRTIEHLENPPSVPDLSDRSARLTYQGHRYRIVGSAMGRDRTDLHLKLDERGQK